MSLSVYLYNKPLLKEKQINILVEDIEGGKSYSIKEWNELNPSQTIDYTENFQQIEAVYWRNITHNLTRMAEVAGIYEHLWRPEEIGITQAKQLIESLGNSLAELKTNPIKYREYNPISNWGNYEGLVEFISSYLTACKKYPECFVYASR